MEEILPGGSGDGGKQKGVVIILEDMKINPDETNGLALVEDDVSNLFQLLPNEMLQRIYSNLNLETLKSVRKVSPSWNANVLQVMKERCRCVMSLGDHTLCSNLVEIMQKAEKIPFQEFRINFEKRVRFDKMKEISLLVGESLTKLTFQLEFSGPENNVEISCATEDLLFILKNCKKLKHLVLRGIRKHSIALEPFRAFDDRQMFASIKRVEIFEIPEDSQFSLNKIFLPHFFATMPNLQVCKGHLYSQYEMEMFMTELVAGRKKGLLQHLYQIGLYVIKESLRLPVYFSKNLFEMLMGLKLGLENLKLCNFTFSNCFRIGGEDIPLELFEKLFKEGNETLQKFSLCGNNEVLPMRSLKLPILQSLTNINIEIPDAFDFMQNNGNLERLFPKMKILSLETEWNRRIYMAYPFLLGNWAKMWLTLLPTGDQEQKSRVVAVNHYEADWYFQKNHFFNSVYNWFPSTKIISCKVYIHYGLLNLLRGFYSTPVEEMYIDVDCAFCKLSPAESLAIRTNRSFLYNERDYQNKVPKTFATPPYPELRLLTIDISRCKSLDMLYIYNSDAMKLLTSAPKLKKILVIEWHGLTTRKVVLNFNVL